MTVNIVMVIITIVLSVCCILSFTKKKDNGLQQALMIIVTAVVGIGTLLLQFAPESTIKVVIPEITEIVEDNAELKTESEKLKADYDSKDKELKQLKESLKNEASFMEYEFYLKGNKINSNSSNSVAKINDQLYFSQNVLEGICGDKLNEDSDNKIFYIGKYPEEQVDLLSVSEPYDPTYPSCFKLGKDDSFKIQSNMYSDGFVLEASRDGLRSVKFNLDNKYSELSFNIGHVDGKPKNSIFTLNVYVDGQKQKEITCNADTVLEDKQIVPLNYGKTLKFEWICDDNDVLTQYGLINIKVK